MQTSIARVAAEALDQRRQVRPQRLAEAAVAPARAVAAQLGLEHDHRSAPHAQLPRRPQPGVAAADDDDVGADVAVQRRRRLDATGLGEPVAVGGVDHSALEEALRGVGQHGLGLRRHLLELLARADQRRGEVQHGVAAVVGAGDQALLEQPAGDEAAQQLLALLGREARAGRVAHQLQRPEEAGAAHVADDRHARLDALEQLAEHRLELAHVLEHALALEDLDVAQRDRGRHRVPGERDAVHQHPALFVQRLGDLVADDHGAHRRVGGRDALGARDQVRRDAVARGGEPLADAPEAGDDLVGDQRDAVLVAQRAQPGPVAVGRHEAAAGVLDRLGDQHRHGLRPGLDDRALDLVQQPRAQRGLVLGVGIAVAVGVGDPHDRDRRRAERLLHRPHAGERERAERHPVVGDLARDRLRALRLALGQVVLADDLPGRLDRLRAAVGEEDAVEVAGRALGERGGELDRRRVRGRPVRVERERGELRGRDRGHLLAERVADLAAEERRQAVEVAVALGVEDVGALAALEHEQRLAVRAEGAVAREVHQQVPVRLLLERVGTHRVGDSHAAMLALAPGSRQ